MSLNTLSRRSAQSVALLTLQLFYSLSKATCRISPRKRLESKEKRPATVLFNDRERADPNFTMRFPGGGEGGATISSCGSTLLRCRQIGGQEKGALGGQNSLALRRALPVSPISLSGPPLLEGFVHQTKQ